MTQRLDIIRWRLRTLAVAAALGALAACSQQDPSQLVAAGRDHLDKKEYRAAVIEFKNALQRDGSLDEARFLLGRALLESGDASGALVEFSKLQASGFNASQLLPPLAEAMLVQGEIEKLITAFADEKLDVPKAQAELAATLASAYGIRGELEKAQASAEASLSSNPEGLSGRLVLAQIKYLRGDPTGAMNEMDKAERAHPQAARVKVFKGELMAQMKGRFDNAAIAQTYREALALEPKNIKAHTGLIQLALVQRDSAAANAQLELLRKAHPGAVLTLYFTALVAFERKDIPAATEAIQAMMKLSPDNVAGLNLAGRIAFEAGNYAQAVAHLGKALPRSTQPIPVRLMLARALLRSGDSKAALSTLQPLLGERSGVPAEAYTLAADAKILAGENEAAKQLYQRALSLNAQDERARSALAVLDISAGRVDQGLGVLKDVAKTSKGLEADVLVVATYLRNRQFDQARAMIDTIDKKEPIGLAAPYLRAELALAQGDVAESARQYEVAAQRDKKDFAPIAALGALDQRAGKPEAALARYRGFLEANPKSISAELAIVSLGKAGGNPPAKVATELEVLVKKYPDREYPRVALVRALLEAGDLKGAQAVAAQALTAFPSSAATLDAAGIVELAAGNYNQARQMFTQLVSLKPKDAEPLMRLSQAALASKDAQGALAHLGKALALEPTNMDAQLQMVKLLARMGQHDRALTQARASQAVAPADPMGWMLEGDLLNSKRDFAGAVAAYRKGLAKSRVGASAVKLHRALEDAGQLKEAQALEKEWRTQYPQDPFFNYYLGDRYLVLGELDTAASLYRSVLAVVPKDPASLNNMAWILGRQGKPEALEMGERAVALAPKSSAALDTLAELHLRAGHMDRAITLQRQAVDYAPDEPVMRLRLAEYLVKDKQLPAARKELDVLAGLGAKFPKQEDVKRLMSQL